MLYWRVQIASSILSATFQAGAFAPPTIMYAYNSSTGQTPFGDISSLGVFASNLYLAGINFGTAGQVRFSLLAGFFQSTN